MLAFKAMMSMFVALSLNSASTVFAHAKDAITIDLSSEPLSLDPQLSSSPNDIYVYSNLFDNLIGRDDSGALEPFVATEWRYLSDNELEFTIREGIKFHDGTDLTAEDVAFSINRIIDPAYGSKAIAYFTTIEEATVTGPDKVLITTKSVYPVLISQLVKLPVVPKHYVEAVGNEEFNLKPIGSGAYKLAAWNRGVGVDLVRNDDYWGAKGKFEKVSFHVVPDAATRLANLRAGTTDLAASFDTDMAAQVESAGLKVLAAQTERVAFMKIGVERAPTNDIRLRQAIAHAIDREAIIEGLLAGYNAATDQLIPSASFGVSDKLPPFPSYDPERAKALIAEIGDAAKQEITFLTTPQYDQRVVAAIQQMLTEVGLNIRMEMLEFGAWQVAYSTDSPQYPGINFLYWSCRCQDADGLYYSLLHTGSRWAKATGATPEIDALLVAGRGNIDPAERQKAYDQVALWVHETLPFIPMYEISNIYGAAPQLQWTPTSNESMYLNRMSWSAN